MVVRLLQLGKQKTALRGLKRLLKINVVKSVFMEVLKRCYTSSVKISGNLSFYSVEFLL